jgi:hypothetical protein
MPIRILLIARIRSLSRPFPLSKTFSRAWTDPTKFPTKILRPRCARKSRNTAPIRLNGSIVLRLKKHVLVRRPLRLLRRHLPRALKAARRKKKATKKSIVISLGKKMRRIISSSHTYMFHLLVSALLRMNPSSLRVMMRVKSTRVKRATSRAKTTRS